MKLICKCGNVEDLKTEKSSLYTRGEIRGQVRMNTSLPFSQLSQLGQLLNRIECIIKLIERGRFHLLTLIPEVCMKKWSTLTTTKRTKIPIYPTIATYISKNLVFGYIYNGDFTKTSCNPEWAPFHHGEFIPQTCLNKWIQVYKGEDSIWFYPQRFSFATSYIGGWIWTPDYQDIVDCPH